MENEILDSKAREKAADENKIKWPIVPNHITDDGNKYKSYQSNDPADEEEKRQLSKLDGTGIIPNEYLMGVQTAIWGKIDNSTMIIEFSPDGKSLARTGSNRGFELTKCPCKKFREYEKNYCKNFDIAHAKLFYGLNKSDFVNKISEKIAEFNCINELQIDLKCVDSLYERPEVISDDRRPYISYNCPFLGYRELAFPIFFEDKVIAVIFVGQIILKDNLSYIAEKQQNFFDAKPTHSTDCNALNYIRKDILDEHNKLIINPRNVWDRNRYNETIDKVFEQLENLEKTLIEQIYLKRQGYINDKVNPRIQQFRKSLSHDLNTYQQDLSQLWSNLGECLESIRSDFALKYIAVFGTKDVPKENGHNPYKDNKSSLDIVVSVGDAPEELKINSPIKFSLSILNSSELIEPTDSKQKPELFDCFEGLNIKIEQENNIILLFPLPFLAESSITIVVGFYDWNPYNAPHNKSGSYLDTTLQSFDNVVLCVISSILASISLQNAVDAKEKLNNALRIFGHETAQITAGLEWLIATHFSPPENLKYASDKTLETMYKDMESNINIIKLLSRNASMLAHIPNPTKSKFWAFKDLLFKWGAMFRLDANKKNLIFEIHSPELNDPYRPQVNGDVRLLEQVVYNLVSNAVKYAYRGTKIHIDCKKENTMPNSPHIFTVTNYGSPIDEEDRDKIYNLYYRSAKAKSQAQGLGVGLYIVKKIAEGHGGSLTHTCEEVSKFNVPLIYSYINREFNEKDSNLVKELKDELSRLKSEELYDNISTFSYSQTTENQYQNTLQQLQSSLKQFNVPKKDLVSSICNATYKITFYVKIP